MALKMNITGPRAALLLTVVMTASGGLWLNARPLTMQGVQPAQVAAAIKTNSASVENLCLATADADTSEGRDKESYIEPDEL